MNILITMQKGLDRDYYFPSEIIETLKEFGNVKLNDSDTSLTEAELKDNIKDIDICLTHWGCPRFTEDVLKEAGRLKLIAHAAGSVAGFIGSEVYERGIVVCSANYIMAKNVAEGTLTYILSGLRAVTRHDTSMKKGEWRNFKAACLLNKKVGLVGLGTVGRWLLDFLRPFDVEVMIYDPYVVPDIISGYPYVWFGALDELLSWSDVISVHVSKTPETYHLLDKGKLGMIKDGALFVNTARGAVVDESALVDELKTGRISAVLDVFEVEPLPSESPLRSMDNVTLIPHRAECGIHTEMTQAMIRDIKHFINNESLEFQISYDKCRLMTRE